MTGEEIRRLLVELGSRLAARSIEGELYVVGGAAIALAFDERRSTRDIVEHCGHYIVLDDEDDRLCAH